MFDTSIIEKMSKEDKLSLIEYLESLPDSIDSFVKINFLKDYLDPSLYNGKRKIYPSCTLRNYLKKKPLDPDEYELVDNPDESMYQPKFCKLDDMISSSKFSDSEKLLLMTILKAKAASEQDLLNIEITIGEFLKNNSYAAYDFIVFLTNTLMPYKYEAYGFYMYLVNRYNLSLIEDYNEDFNYMKNLQDTIRILIHNSLFEYGTYKNIAILLYVYFSALYIQDRVDKYNLLERFRYYISDANSFDEIRNEYDSLVSSNCIISEALSYIVNPEKIGSIFDKLGDVYIKNLNDIITIGNSGHIIKEGNIILHSEDSDVFRDNISEIAEEVSLINNDEIVKYVDKCDSSVMIKTYFFDNDLGHLSHFENLYIATVYNSLTNEMHYICRYEGKFYVLFKLLSDANTIYGLELTPSMDEKRILKLSMDKNIKYKFTYGF